MRAFHINFNDKGDYPPKKSFLIRTVVIFLSVLITYFLFDSVKVSSFAIACVTALIISLLNAYFKVFLKFSYILSLVLIACIVHMISLGVEGVVVRSFFDACWFSFEVSIIGFLLFIPIRVRAFKKTFTSQNNNNENEQLIESEEFTSYEEVVDEENDDLNKK